MLTVIRTAVRRARTNRRIARASYCEAHIRTVGTELWLNSSTYGYLTPTMSRTDFARTGAGPVPGVRLPVNQTKMGATPECGAIAMGAAEGILLAAGWIPAEEWRHCWSDSELDTWDVRIVHA